jgi:hypothetical protein
LVIEGVIASMHLGACGGKRLGSRIGAGHNVPHPDFIYLEEVSLKKYSRDQTSFSGRAVFAR